MGVTEEVARFTSELTWEVLPPKVVEIAQDHISDAWGVTLAGSGQDSAQILRQVLEVGGTGAVPVVGTDRRASALVAALLNGTAGHALDYDDTQLSTSPEAVYGLLTHPSVPVLSAASALACERPTTGRALVVAYVAGVEVACRVADAMDSRHYQDGFHSTGTAGAIGAAAAAAKILGLGPDVTATALGIAASQSAGLRENFGTMTKPLHAGRAAQSGVLAALLAEAGFTASRAILEAPRGFLNAAAGGFDSTKLAGCLGSPFFLETPGVSIKPYPSGSLSHPAQDLILSIVARENLAPEQIERVEVGTNSNVLNALIHHRPTTGLEGKFSLEYCMATGVVRRRAGLSDFTDEAVQDPELQAFLPKVDVVVDQDLEALGFQHVRSRVTVNCTDGRIFQGTADWARGYPQKPLTAEELEEKFVDCAGVVFPPDRARGLWHTVSRVGTAELVGTVMEELAS